METPEETKPEVQKNEFTDTLTDTKPVVSVISETKKPETSTPQKLENTPEKLPEVIKPKKQPKRRKWTKVVFYLSVASIIATAFWQRQNIIDWYLLRNYQPPTNIVQLADKSSMSDYGRRLFYINRPNVQDKKSFYISCEKGETAIVLGCYVPNKGIFLLDVTDNRLDGVEEVTAAHEMLHFAYGRLSFAKRKEIDGWVSEAYKKLNNENITKKIDVYKKSGADVNNELHSMLATEVKNLPPQLHEYYRQYFKDRSKVVELSDKFQAEFTARKKRVEELDAQLTSIEAQIVANNKKLDELEKAINAEKARLDALLRNEDIDEYNSGVVAYNQSLVPYRSLISQTRGLIASYKAIHTERNKVAEEAQELNKALDSNLTTTNEDI